MSERVITIQQLEAWAAAIKMTLAAEPYSRYCGDPAAGEAMMQALEDMGEVMADDAVEEVEDDPQLYDPDANSDGWEYDNDPDDLCDGKDQNVWYL